MPQDEPLTFSAQDEPPMNVGLDNETDETNIYDGDGYRRRETNQPAVPGGVSNEAGDDDSQGLHYGGSMLDDEQDGGFFDNIADTAEDVWDWFSGLFGNNQKGHENGTDAEAAGVLEDEVADSGEQDTSDWSQVVNNEIVDETVGYAISGAAEATGGRIAEVVESTALEFVFNGIPYAGIVVDCAGQLQASEDATTALLENYINFGANQWNMANSQEYRDALVWSPMATVELNQDFLDKAMLLQQHLNDYELAGNPECAGMYWDEILEDDRKIKEYNENHPNEEKRESKLDFLKWMVTQTTNSAFQDYTAEVVTPIGKIAVESWVSIYFGDGWGMHY